MVRVGGRIALLAFVALLLAAPTADAGPRVSVQIGVNVPVAPVAPVAVPVAVVPATPVPYGYVWRPAYYVWTGYGYQLVPGGWVRPPHPHAVWVPGRWVARPRGSFWAQGYWRH